MSETIHRGTQATEQSASGGPAAPHHIIPVWFFVGVLLLIYGVMILASGLAEWSSPPDTVLANLHAPVWWGALLTVMGAGYCLAFRPGKGS